MDFDNFLEAEYILPNNLMGKQTAIIYTRVSTRQQIKGVALQRQHENCSDFAEQSGLTVVGVYEDAGVCGNSYLSRPALESALLDLEVGVAEVLIVEDFCRISQNREHLTSIRNRVLSAGAVLVFSEDYHIGSPSYELQQQMNQSLQEYKRAILEAGILELYSGCV